MSRFAWRALLPSLVALCTMAAELPSLSTLAKQPIRIYGPRDGLRQMSIEALARDSRGMLWVGTQDGVMRYNGHAWEALPLPRAQVSNWVNCIEEDAGGNLWIGTNGGGVHRWDGTRWESFSVQLGFPSDRVNQVLPTRGAGETQVWVGTQDAGLFCYSHGRMEGVAGPWGRQAPAIQALAETFDDSGASLWVGTDRGLFRRGPAGWQYFGRKDFALSEDSVLSLAASSGPDGPALWVGTRGGLARLEGGRWTAFGAAALKGSVYVNALAVSRGEGHTPVLWAGTDGGLVEYRDGSWTRYQVPQGLPANVIRCLLSDPEERGTPLLWIGTYAGLARLAPGKWLSLTTGNGLSENLVYAITETRDGSLWFGTMGGGICRLQGNAWTTHRQVDGRPVKAVFCFLRGHAGGREVLYAGTRDEGLLVWENGRWRRWELNHLLPDPRIHALLETRDAKGSTLLWIGTRNGLACVRGTKVDILTTANGLPHNHITALAEIRELDGAATLWVGTRGGGLARRVRDRWETFGPEHGLPSQQVACITQARDASGKPVLWIGTMYGGSVRLDPCRPDEPWRVLNTTTDPALPNDTTSQIRVDDQGHVYFFTDHGVARLVEGDSKGHGGRMYTYTMDDGLPADDCTMNSTFMDSLGRIWTGTVGGVACLDPARRSSDDHPKTLVFDAARILSDGTPLAQGTVLGYRQGHLAFEVALLDFFREDDVRYRFQLLGLDEEPSAWGPSPRKEYPVLPDGTYAFLAWGRDHAGNVSGPISYRFRVRPAPWRHPLAYAAYILFFLGLGLLASRLRIRMLRHRNELLKALVDSRTADLAERTHQLEERTHQLEISEHKAQEATLAKSRFLANMSHELRTPLNAILGFAQLMRRHPDRSREDQEHLNRIHRAGEHLLGLINDVLSISKIEAGRLTLNLAPFPFRSFVQGIAEMIGVRTDEKGLELAFHVSEDVPEAIEGDEGKLRQVLINLLSNAVKFTEQGEVTLTVGRASTLTTFEVKDTGPGMSPEELRDLFGAFSQTETGRKAKEGTGLGLHISQAMVKLMGGEIEVESQIGKGTSFRFSLPLKAADTLPQNASEAGDVEGLAEGQPSLKILVVDDRADNRDLLRELLVGWGFTVQEAADGLEALEIWETWSPDAIWMDLRMPRMDGHGAVQRIREREAQSGHPRIPVFALSSSVLETERATVLAEGFDEFIGKPFREEEIAQALECHTGIRFRRTQAEIRGTEEALKSEALAKLPEAWAAAFRKALVTGDSDEALRLLGDLEDAVLARQIEPLLQAYRFGDLLRMLDH